MLVRVEESWCPVPGWELFYEVSDLGRVRSLPRQTSSGRRGGKILQPARKNTYGHLKVTLSKPGQRVTRDVHWLVTRAFLGDPPPGTEACHGTGGASDNSLANLRYGTCAQNQQDRLRDGTDSRGEKNVRAKLTWEKVRQIRLRASEPHRLLAEEFGVSPAAIWQVLHNRQWKEPSP